jgi:molybdopterin converting factor small subunit
MPSTLDTIREALQAALLPKLTAIEKDLQSLRAEVAQSNQEMRAEMKQSNQELRAEGIENYQGLRAEISQNSQELRAEMRQSSQELRGEMQQINQELRAELELKFTMLVNEIQKIGLRTELTAEKFKAETETYVHRNITPLAERVAVLEMSFRDLKAKLEKAS